jgi:hypothetical protein
MTMTESLEALRRANPRGKPGLAESVEAAAGVLRERMDSDADVAVEAGAPARRRGRPTPRRRLRRAWTVGVSLAAVAAVAAVVAVGSPVGGPGVANAAAAVRRAAAATAVSAEHSGTVVVRITHDSRIWTGTTIRWNGRDLAVSRDAPRRPAKAGSRFLVVDGTMYGIDPERGDWVSLGSPDGIDPDSGTTPGEYLAAVSEDVGGVTLRRITDGMTDLTRRKLDDGSTVFSGTVAAGLIARETGFKEGQQIRVLPFGDVAHDEAANPANPLRAALDRRLGVEVHGHLLAPGPDPGPGRARQRALPARAPARQVQGGSAQPRLDVVSLLWGCSGRIPCHDRAAAGLCARLLQPALDRLAWTGV